MIRAVSGIPVLAASSAEVYGMVAEEHQPIAESSPLSPRSPYALTKAAMERFVLAGEGVVMRSFNIIGPGQARSFAELAKALFAALERPERIEFIPTPEAIRDKYQYFTQAEIGRLRAAGYGAPFTSLEAGVARYVGDYLAADDPYR